jgi:hypothetical protein
LPARFLLAKENETVPVREASGTNNETYALQTSCG